MKIKIHVMRYHDPKEFDDDTLDIGLSPIDPIKILKEKRESPGKSIYLRLKSST